MVFDRTTTAHLYETRLSEDQAMKDLNNDSVLLTATVKNTSELRQWLLVFEDKVEVLKPVKLEQEFAGIFESLHNRYKLRLVPLCQCE